MGRLTWPMPSPTTCASGANAVLMMVTVGMPRSSSATASRAVQGVEEPQWPTPLITPSQCAAIFSAYGDGMPRYSFRQTVTSATP
jgi:hypothetical protein